MHCPRCGAFHMFSMENFAGSPTCQYRCSECATEENLMQTQRKNCAFCGRVCKVAKCIELMVGFNTDYPFDICQWIVLCKPHLSVANKRLRPYMTKDDLWRILTADQARKARDRAMGKYRGNIA
jgi:hypothetical protein